MGEIFLARQNSIAGIEKLVVVKMVRHDLSTDPDYVEMFLEEARVAVLTRHPNVVAALDAGHSERGYYLVLEYLRGWDLGRIVQRCIFTERFLSPAHILRIGIEAARGLAHIHGLETPEGKKLHVVHRDISPGNIMVTTNGETKIMDFGIAKPLLSVISTRPGTHKGKAAYMSPEQAAGKKVGPAADQFALGLVLFELCTNQPRYRGNSFWEIMQTAILAEPVSPRSLRRDLPVELDEVLMKALQKNPCDRFERCVDFARALESVARSTGHTVERAELGELLTEIMPTPFGA